MRLLVTFMAYLFLHPKLRRQLFVLYPGYHVATPLPTAIRIRIGYLPTLAHLVDIKISYNPGID